MQYQTRIIGGLSLVAALTVSGCATTPQPVFYTNEHLQTVGKEAADQATLECRSQAEQAGARNGASGAVAATAESTAVGAVVGAASGAVGGAIVGAAGTGSAIGAASGATAGLLRALFGLWNSPPDPAYAAYMTRCLQDRGFETVGWE